MIIELEINGAHVIISGDNLTVNMTQQGRAKGDIVAERSVSELVPTPAAIKSLRKNIGVGQTDFARMVRVNQATISRWETGLEKPSGPASALLMTMIMKTPAEGAS